MFSENITKKLNAANLIKPFLNQRASVQVQNDRGATPLHLAFHLGLQHIVAMLLRSFEKAPGEVANLLDNENLSYLHIFCTLKDHRQGLARKLLSSEQDLKSTINIAYKGKNLANVKTGWTPLHVAVNQFQVSLVQLLLQRGASTACKDAQGYTPAFQLFGTDIEANGTKSLADLLFAPERPDEGTCLHLAVWFNDVESVERLLDSGANIEATVDDLEGRDLGEYVGCTPLHVAVIANRLKIMDILLRRGANVLAKNRNGASLLLRALLTGSFGGSRDEFVQLIQGDDNLQKRMEEELGLTLLHIACHCHDETLVDEALRKGNDVNARLPETSIFWAGYSPLHVLVACTDSYWFGGEALSTFRKLVQKDCDIDTQDSTGKTAFHLALATNASHYAQEATPEFLSAGADISIMDRSGKSAISYALESYSDCWSQHLDNAASSVIFQLLLHMHKMKFVGMEISELDQALALAALQKRNVRTDDFPRQRVFYDQVQATEGVKIGRRGLTLRSFLYETHAISMYPSLTPEDRLDVATFFQSFNYGSFPKLSPFIKIQFKKAITRLSLIDPARDALKIFISPNFPELCIDIILKYLSNSQLKQLITASVDDSDM